MSRPDAAEQIGHGPESRGQSETADVDDEVDPRKRATDPTRRRVSRTAGEALTDAVNSLDGVAVHANTLIIGDASVGTMVGRDYLGAVSGRGFVPSGPVSPTMLQHLENTFVPPSRFEEVRSRLRKQKVLLLRAPKGWGRTAAALRALAEDCGAGVQKLNPDVRLRSLELEFTPETGYLLESLEVAQAIALRSFHLEQLSQTLTTYRCRMIVVLDNEIELPADIDSFLLDGGEPPDVTQLVSKHLDWRLRGEPTNVLERPEVVSLLAEMGEYRAPARELALLAGQLAQVAVGRVEITDIVTQYSAAADIRFQQWFDELDVEARAFAIALAVFNGMPLHIVSSAGRVLAQLIMDEEISDVSQHRRSVFGTRSAELLSRTRVELYQSSEETEYGRIPVQAARFEDHRYPRRVLEYVWHQYHAAHELVREWLRLLGADPDLRVCTRAGVAVGLLSTFEFEHARRLVIEPWADSGERHDRFAAIGALQFPSLRPELTPLITRMLAGWLRGSQPLPRRATAAAALGSTVGQLMPNRALELLRGAARSSEMAVQEATCYSMLQLFKVPQLTSMILGELRIWTDSEEVSLRETGFRCVLELSFGVAFESSRSTRPWPAMVWLANESADHRDSIIILFARLMEAPYYMPAAYREIRRWVRIAEKDHQLRGPLGKMLRDFGRAIHDAETVSNYLRDWAEEHQGPVQAVNELLTILDQEEEST
ncbi:hypothetical protein [Nocardia brasiliensis]|uniref:hypothetical protein n=4 Tax=Nocardia brasiliensis TaxID=37326 RepID=UPI00245750FE|nr:hypothetical protein [Nocardia brasiliensis]